MCVSLSGNPSGFHLTFSTFDTSSETQKYVPNLSRQFLGDGKFYTLNVIVLECVLGKSWGSFQFLWIAFDMRTWLMIGIRNKKFSTNFPFPSDPFHNFYIMIRCLTNREIYSEANIMNTDRLEEGLGDWRGRLLHLWCWPDR